MKIKVGGYVKLAKLWERKRHEAIDFHNEYYFEKYKNDPEMELQEVYIDITGNKDIWKRPNMLRLLRDCELGKIDCIATQTKAYLAANTEDFFFLIYYLFNLPNRIDIITEDANYNIDTIINKDKQREALFTVSYKYVSVEPKRYSEWGSIVRKKIETLED